MVAARLTLTRTRPSARRLAAALLAATALVTGVLAPAGAPATTRAAEDEVTILTLPPGTLDPAAAGDAASSEIIQQLFETLTAIDPSLTVRPALAERWELSEEGRRITFHLRPNLTFSDGTPLTAEDVVRSWLRIADPEAPSPLVALILDVQGAADYLAGDVGPEGVGLQAVGDQVVVDLVRPAGEFASVVASPTFAVVPESVADDPESVDADEFVGSGGYVLADATSEEMTLTANERYWAGRPPIGTVHVVFDIGGRSPVQAFEEGDVDYTQIGDFDATWIRFDPSLGPSLRAVPAFTLEYIGFDTTEPPFDDPLVRRAFARAVDWSRLVELAGGSATEPATGMVPTGIPGRSDRNFVPEHDPDAARELLAEAGYPDGAGFPDVTYLSSGGTVDTAFVADVERELGVDVRYELAGFDGYSDRLEDETPDIWILGWIADYPGANDFLGVLLGTGATTNYGRWSNAEFDTAIAEAGLATDPDAARAAYERAEAIVQEEVPVVPVAYSGGWALSREGLLGASENGLGSLRFAGLAWDE